MTFSNRSSFENCKKTKPAQTCFENCFSDFDHFYSVLSYNGGILSNLKQLSQAFTILQISCSNSLKTYQTLVDSVLTRKKINKSATEKYFLLLNKFSINIKKISEKLQTYTILLPKQLQDSFNTCIPMEKKIFKNNIFEKIKSISYALKTLADRLETILNGGKYRTIGTKKKVVFEMNFFYKNSMIYRIYHMKKNIQKKYQVKELIEKIDESLSLLENLDLVTGIQTIFQCFANISKFLKSEPFVPALKSFIRKPTLKVNKIRTISANRI